MDIFLTTCSFKPKVHVSFSDHLLSVVRQSICLKTFHVPYFFFRTTGPNFTKLIIKNLYGKGILNNPLKKIGGGGDCETGKKVCFYTSSTCKFTILELHLLPGRGLNSLPLGPTLLATC